MLKPAKPSDSRPQEGPARLLPPPAVSPQPHAAAAAAARRAAAARQREQPRAEAVGGVGATPASQRPRQAAPAAQGCSLRRWTAPSWRLGAQAREAGAQTLWAGLSRRRRRSCRAAQRQTRLVRTARRPIRHAADAPRSAATGSGLCGRGRPAGPRRSASVRVPPGWADALAVRAPSAAVRVRPRGGPGGPAPPVDRRASAVDCFWTGRRTAVRPPQPRRGQRRAETTRGYARGRQRRGARRGARLQGRLDSCVRRAGPARRQAPAGRRDDAPAAARSAGAHAFTPTRASACWAPGRPTGQAKRRLFAARRLRRSPRTQGTAAPAEGKRRRAQRRARRARRPETGRVDSRRTLDRPRGRTRTAVHAGCGPTRGRTRTAADGARIASASAHPGGTRTDADRRGPAGRPLPSVGLRG